MTKSKVAVPELRGVVVGCPTHSTLSDLLKLVGSIRMQVAELHEVADRAFGARPPASPEVHLSHSEGLACVLHAELLDLDCFAADLCDRFDNFA